MKPWFVGQKVCCILDVSRWVAIAFPRGHFVPFKRTDPVVGQTYTIAGIHENPFFQDVLSLALRELPDGVAYTDSAFRPLVDSQNDISAFRAIVDKMNRQKELTHA